MFQKDTDCDGIMFNRKCHPFPEKLVNTREKVAVREESSLTPLLLFLSLIKTQSMPIKAMKELLLFFCLSTDPG